MNMECVNQIVNEQKAISAFKVLLDCFEEATPEFRQHIGGEFSKELYIRAQSNSELNYYLWKTVDLIQYIRSCKF